MLLITPRRRLTQGPVVEDVLRNVTRRIIRGEREVFRLPTDQNQPKVHLEMTGALDLQVNGATAYQRLPLLLRPQRRQLLTAAVSFSREGGQITAVREMALCRVLES